MALVSVLISRQSVFRNGKDLNRDFPDVINQTTATRIPPPLLRRGDEQPETIAIMDWAESRSFVASAAMHEVNASLIGRSCLTAKKVARVLCHRRVSCSI